MRLKHLSPAIGRAIARQRVKRGLTQEEVAERLGVGNEAVSRIERGVVTPNIERLVQFAALFGCETIELLTEASSNPDDQAAHIRGLLATLTPEDRQLVLEWVERLTERLRRG